MPEESIEAEPQRGPFYPLTEFLSSAVHCEPLTGEAMPQPQRSLLVHASDMTPTLETYHGERIHLRLLEKRVEGSTLLRLVVLTTNDSRKPVEYGAIAIHLDRFSEAARERVIGCRIPLGTILAEEAIPHVSCPSGFFRIDATPALVPTLLAAFQLTAPVSLYGRRSALRTPDGAVLADVVEILPP